MSTPTTAPASTSTDLLPEDNSTHNDVSSMDNSSHRSHSHHNSIDGSNSYNYNDF